MCRIVGARYIYCLRASHCLPRTMSVAPTQALNLSVFYPLDPWPVLQTRVEVAAQQKFTLSRQLPPANGIPFDPLAPEDQAALERDVIIQVEMQDRKGVVSYRDLATFPCLYFIPLTILYNKWEFYYKLYQALAAIETTAEFASRQLDLKDHWLRDVLYLERVLEMAMQWSHRPDRSEICMALFLFVCQEDTSSDHSLENTRGMTFALDDAHVLERCEYGLLSFFICPAHRTPLAMQDWIDADDGSRSWLLADTITRVDELAHAALAIARAESPVRPQRHLLDVPLTRSRGSSLQ